MNFTSIDSLQSAIREQNYIAERGLGTSLYLALKLTNPNTIMHCGIASG
ncbi:MAG: hypothetical protein L0Z71_04075 [Anaerolineae bacterium]|nr:hypothetical protein [Anaerolineae bacterium]